MSEDTWKPAWRAWLAARFGNACPEALLDAAVRDAEGMRRYGDRLRAVRQPNGEAPFSCLLPPSGEVAADAEGDG